MNFKFYLWISIFAIIAISMKDLLWEQEMSEKWNSDSDEEIMYPNCIPDFFNPVTESCYCIGSGKRIEEKDVEKAYCYPQRNIFKLNINPSKQTDRKNVFPPKEYDENLISNQPLQNCVQSANLSVENVCFCGNEENKDDLKQNGSLDENNFVKLKHICVPLEEQEDKKHIFSLLVPQYKKSYCYRNQCQTTEYVPSQEYSLGPILMGTTGNVFFKYLTNLEKIKIGGTNKHARFQMQRLLTQGDYNIARALHARHNVQYPVNEFEYCLLQRVGGMGHFNFPVSSFGNFEINFENSEIARFFPNGGYFEISIRTKKEIKLTLKRTMILEFTLHIGIFKNAEDKFMICVDVLDKNSSGNYDFMINAVNGSFLSNNIIFEHIPDNSSLTLRFLSSDNILKLHPRIEEKIEKKLDELESKIKDIDPKTEKIEQPLNINLFSFQFYHANTNLRSSFIKNHFYKFFYP